MLIVESLLDEGIVFGFSICFERNTALN